MIPTPILQLMLESSYHHECGVRHQKIRNLYWEVVVCMTYGGMEISSLIKYSWANSATPDVLEVLSNTSEADIPLKGKTIHITLIRWLDDPPSEMTVYRALKGLEEQSYVTKSEADRYFLSEEGKELVKSYEIYEFSYEE